MTVPVNRAPYIGVRPTRGHQPLGKAASEVWATGVLMAATPCSARDAERMLAAAAHLVQLSVRDLADVLVAGAGGASLPAHVERALYHAAAAAQAPTPAVDRPTALTPSRARTEEALSRLWDCQARLAMAPEDTTAQRAMDDAAYTLCVLMGSPTARDAVSVAQRRLAVPAP